MGLTGGLDELALADLVEMTGLGGKSGRLTLYDEEGASAGELAFRDGRLVGATCGPLRAEKAFYNLLSLKRGSFAFDPQAQLDEETCNLPTESLLMEGMRRIDEVRRLRQLMPAPATVRLLGAGATDEIEARVLAYLGPGARTVGDIMEGLLVAGDIDEYDALKALSRLADREVVRVEAAYDAAGPLAPPQPELER